MATEKRIVATGYAIVGNLGGPSDSLAPGEYVVFDDESESHKQIEREIESGKVTALEIQEVDVRKEQADKQAAEVELDMQRHAEARAQQEEVREAQIQAGEGVFDPSGQPVAEVLAYLRQADADEVQRVQRLEAATDRNSKQVADFEAKDKE